MKFEESSSGTFDSEKEMYEQLGREIEPLRQKLNAIDESIALVRNEKSPKWRRRRWQRIQYKKLEVLGKQRTDVLKPLGRLNDIRANSAYGRKLQSERDRERSQLQSERDKAKYLREQEKASFLRESSTKNSSSVSNARTYYYDDDDDDMAPSFDELAQDWGFDSWGDFSETID